MKTRLAFLGVAVVATLAVVAFAARPTQGSSAISVLVPGEGSTVSGVVRFEQTPHGVMVTGEVAGLEPGTVHGFHVHEFGDLTSKDGSSLGGHYNPGASAHGLPGAGPAHAGDMGNITANDQGVATVHALLPHATISGESSLLGRGIVVHAKADDGGQPTGNAGGRIAFGVIGVAKAPSH